MDRSRIRVRDLSALNATSTHSQQHQSPTNIYQESHFNYYDTTSGNLCGVPETIVLSRGNNSPKSVPDIEVIESTIDIETEDSSVPHIVITDVRSTRRDIGNSGPPDSEMNSETSNVEPVIPLTPARRTYGKAIQRIVRRNTPSIISRDAPNIIRRKTPSIVRRNNDITYTYIDHRNEPEVSNDNNVLNHSSYTSAANRNSPVPTVSAVSQSNDAMNRNFMSLSCLPGKSVKVIRKSSAHSNFFDVPSLPSMNSNLTEISDGSGGSSQMIDNNQYLPEFGVDDHSYGVPLNSPQLNDIRGLKKTIHSNWMSFVCNTLQKSKRISKQNTSPKGSGNLAKKTGKPSAATSTLRRPSKLQSVENPQKRSISYSTATSSRVTERNDLLMGNTHVKAMENSETEAQPAVKLEVVSDSELDKSESPISNQGKNAYDVDYSAGTSKKAAKRKENPKQSSKNIPSSSMSGNLHEATISYLAGSSDVGAKNLSNANAEGKGKTSVARKSTSRVQNAKKKQPTNKNKQDITKLSDSGNKMGNVARKSTSRIRPTAKKMAEESMEAEKSLLLCVDEYQNDNVDRSRINVARKRTSQIRAPMQRTSVATESKNVSKLKHLTNNTNKTKLRDCRVVVTRLPMMANIIPKIEKVEIPSDDSADEEYNHQTNSDYSNDIRGSTDRNATPSNTSQNSEKMTKGKRSKGTKPGKKRKRISKSSDNVETDTVNSSTITKRKKSSESDQEESDVDVETVSDESYGSSLLTTLSFDPSNASGKDIATDAESVSKRSLRNRSTNTPNMRKSISNASLISDTSNETPTSSSASGPDVQRFPFVRLQRLNLHDQTSAKRIERVNPPSVVVGNVSSTSGDMQSPPPSLFPSVGTCISLITALRALNSFPCVKCNQSKPISQIWTNVRSLDLLCSSCVGRTVES